MTHPLKLRYLNLPARLGVAGFVITAIGGTAASGVYLYMHHNERDQQPGLTVDDVVAHYHGITAEAPLLASLESGHPEGFDQSERQRLVDWLTGDNARLSLDFDNLDLGENAPAEIIALSCLNCHARASTGPQAAPHIPLEYWDDVEALAVSRNIQPVPTEILAASTHTHALGMAAIAIAIGLLGLLTAWPRTVVGLAVGASGVGLTADIGGWWLTRMNPDLAYLVIVGGALFSLGLTLLGLLILADLCMPKPKLTTPNTNNA